MLENHDKFIDEVIKKAINADAQSKIKELRDTEEELTVEALADVSGLSKSKIKKIMEKTRDKKKNVETKKTQKINFFGMHPIGMVITLIGVIAVPFVSNFISDGSNSSSESEIIIVSDEPSYAEKRKAYSAHDKVIKAIKKDDLKLVKHLITVEKIPLYLDKKFTTNGAPRDPLEHTFSQFSMTKLLLELGADPFYNFKKFERNMDLAAEKDSTSYNTYLGIIFNHLVKLESTPTAIKKLWGMGIPYNRDGPAKAYKERNFEALALFNEANTGRYSQFWIERTLEYTLKRNIVEDNEKLFDILITNESNPKKKEFSASIGMILALYYGNHDFVVRFFNAGVNPKIRRTTSDAGNMLLTSANLLFITALANYQDYLGEMLANGNELNKKESKQLLDLLFNRTVQHSPEYQNFYKTIKVLLDYGVEFKEEHLLKFSTKLNSIYTPYSPNYQEFLKEYTETLNSLMANVGVVPLNSKFMDILLTLNDTKNVKYLVESGVEVTRYNIVTAIAAGRLELASYLLNSLLENKKEALKKEVRSRSAYGLVKYLTNKDKHTQTNEQIWAAINYMRDNDLMGKEGTRIKNLLKKVE